MINWTRRRCLQRFASLGLTGSATSIKMTDLVKPEGATEAPSRISATQLLEEVGNLESDYRITHPSHKVIGPKHKEPPDSLYAVIASERSLLIPSGVSKIEAITACYSERASDGIYVRTDAPMFPFRLLLPSDQQATDERFQQRLCQHVRGVKADVTTGHWDNYFLPLTARVHAAPNGADVFLTRQSQRPEAVTQRADWFATVFVRETTAGVLLVKCDGRQFTNGGIRYARRFVNRATDVLDQYQPQQIARPETADRHETRLDEDHAAATEVTADE